MKSGFHVDGLERYAMAEHCRSIPESNGACFHATLILAQEARRLGLAEKVAFVRWRVHRDMSFLEHWAIVLESGTVIDMTAIQVDGDPDPLRRFEGYPANYVRPRRYPAAIVLAVMEAPLPEAGRHISRRQLWRLHKRLFRYDAANALRSGSARGLVDAIDEIARRGATLFVGYLLERAIERMSRILMRMK